MSEASRVALVTGASRGIGAATARILAGRGYRVVVNYRTSVAEADEVVAAVTAAGGEAVAIRADVTESDDVAAMFGEIEQRWGRVDVLVHNALIPFKVASFADADLGAARRQAGPRTSCRVLDHQSRCAGNDLPRVWPADIPQHGVVAPSPRGDDRAGHRQGGAGPVRPVHRT